jgi:gluconate 2-dehydrogenase gamma chain
MADERRFFDERQWETVEAAMARIIPSDEGPGAREAETIRFLDRYLSGVSFIYAKADGSGFRETAGAAASAWRRRIDALRIQYADGIQDLDRRSHEEYGEEFRALTPGQQDRVLADIEQAGQRGHAAGLQEPATEEGLDFFALLVLHTRQGFYSDPIYGGNADHVGWRHLGFPGPSSMAEVHSGAWSTLPYFEPPR